MKDRNVVLSVQTPSAVEITAQERLRLERLEQSEAEGCIAADDGWLLEPGTSTLELDPGLYSFRTLSDVQLDIVSGGVNVAIANSDDKDKWPDPPPATQKPDPTARGAGPVPGPTPKITVTGH